MKNTTVWKARFQPPFAVKGLGFWLISFAKGTFLRGNFGKGTTFFPLAPRRMSQRGRAGCFGLLRQLYDVEGHRDQKGV